MNEQSFSFKFIFYFLITLIQNLKVLDHMQRKPKYIAVFTINIEEQKRKVNYIFHFSSFFFHMNNLFPSQK